MKPRLQASLGQHLVLTPQLRQALHLLQLPAQELEAEIMAAVESNPLLDWAEDEPLSAPPSQARDGGGDDGPEPAADDAGTAGWEDGEGWYDPDPGQRLAKAESLHDHLSWQLHLGHLSPRDRMIAAAIVDAIDDDGYLREPLEAIAEALRPEIEAGLDEIQAVLHQVQRLDPPGVGARGLGECLRLQLEALPADTPGLQAAMAAATSLIDRLPKLGTAGLAEALPCPMAAAEAALRLPRSLN